MDNGRAIDPQGRSRGLMSRSRLIRLAILCVVGGLFAWQASVHEVPTAPTPADIVVIRALLAPVGFEPQQEAVHDLSFDDQIIEIRAVQSLVLQAAPNSDPIPLGQTREPSDLIAARTGLCYDRSRTIEKTLRYLGFRVRHVGIYAVPATGSPWRSLITPGIDSHAASEVRTSRGWLLVGSNDPWISLDTSGAPISLEQMRQDTLAGPATRVYLDGPPSFIFATRFTYVVGLYSRHGGFYPPYDGVPDISLKEALLLSWMK